MSQPFDYVSRDRSATNVNCAITSVSFTKTVAFDSDCLSHWREIRNQASSPRGHIP